MGYQVKDFPKATISFKIDCMSVHHFSKNSTAARPIDPGGITVHYNKAIMWGEVKA